MPKLVMRHEIEHLYATPPTSAEGQRLSAAILRLREAERVQAQRTLTRAGLSHLDLSALRYLVQGYRDGRDLSPKDLIVMLDTSSATVTNVVDRLVHRSLIERVQHPHDRRAHYLVPTEEAIARVDEAFAAHHRAVVEVIDSLSPAEAQVGADIITKLADSLDSLATAESKAG